MEYLSVVFAILVFYNKDIFFVNRIYLKIILLITETFCFIVFVVVVVVEQRNIIESAIDCCSEK